MKINTYHFLINNDIVHVKIDRPFIREIKEKIIQEYNFLKEYNSRKLKICYGTLKLEFNKNKYFKFNRLLKIAKDLGISKKEIFSHIEVFFAKGSNTRRELILSKELIIDEQFVEGYALYLAEGDTGFNGCTIPRKVRFTNSNLEVIRIFIQWLNTYFPNNWFYLGVILPLGTTIQENFINQINKKLNLDIGQIKIENSCYNKKIKYKIYCNQAILIDLILSLENTIKDICIKNKMLAISYIRGMMIGEGTCYFNRSRYVRIEMKNEKEIKYLNKLFRILGFNCNPHLRTERENMWSIYIGAKQLSKFYNEIGFGVHQKRQKILEEAVNKKLRINQYI